MSSVLWSCFDTTTNVLVLWSAAVCVGQMPDGEVQKGYKKKENASGERIGVVEPSDRSNFLLFLSFVFLSNTNNNNAQVVGMTMTCILHEVPLILDSLLHEVQLVLAICLFYPNLNL
jgi:hypothetical protein